MAARPRWWHQLQASKDEVRLAVDLYNRIGQERQLEAFVVHMSLGWLKLIQAEYEKKGKERDLYTLRNGRRQRTTDGDWLMKSLSALLAERYKDSDPIRRNVEFFLGLRHKIEHRYDRDVAALVAGKTQALVLNYEREIVRLFGDEEGLAEELRLPVFLSSITDDAVEAIKRVRGRVPRAVLDYVQDQDAAIDPAVAADNSYEFRLYLIPQTSSASDADAAMTFVRLDDLDHEQRAKVDAAMTIIREKQVPVSNLDSLLPTLVVQRVKVEAQIRFSMTDHTSCWQHFEVRPPERDEHPERTKEQFCRWDSTFKRWVYTEAWVAYLVRKLGDADLHREILGRDPASL
jgi:Protein of unknown function (DUF3644)